MAKQADLRAAKERKQKKIVAVGGVLLVIILFVQVPRTMKMMNAGAEEPVAAPAPAATAPTGTSPAPVSSEPVPQPEVVTASLVSFSRFESKDPFVQQVKDDEDAAAEELPPDASVDVDVDEPPAIAEPDVTMPPVEPAALTQAELEVNGVAETVSVDSTFPVANPMFLLVSVSKRSVGIKVADGGTFSSGDPTLTLTLGKPVTLVNTADGTRFVLKLKGVS